MQQTQPNPDEPEFWQPPPSVFDASLAEIQQCARDYGTDISLYPELLKEITPAQLFSILHRLCSWKYINQQPMSPIERYVFALTGFYMDVNNGGFSQYFYNSAGDDWDALIWGFESSGDSVSLERFRKVLTIFPEGKLYRNRSCRIQQLETVEDMEEELFGPPSREFFDNPFPKLDDAYTFVFSRINEFSFIWPKL